MKRIRVLHVAQAAGGVDRYLQMLLKYFDHDRFENILICSTDYHERDYIGLVDEFEQIPMIRKIGIHDFNSIKELRKVIKKYKPDIIYAHSSKAGAVTRIANMGIRNKCIYNPHGWAFNMHCSEKKKKFYRNVEKILAFYCDKIICISEAEKQSALRNHICKEEKLEVIYNGIDVEQVKKQKISINRKQLHIPDGAFVVGMVGRLSKQKSPDIFIRVAKEIVNIIPNSYFIIVGNGEMEEEIKVYARENNFIDKLIVTGWVNNPLDFVSVFDVATLLSRWEGFGLVLPEYMIMGKPIVASNVDAIPNIIQNRRNGLLVNINNIDEIVSSIKELYDSKMLVNDLVLEGKKDVEEKYNIKDVSSHTVKVMECLLNG